MSTKHVEEHAQCCNRPQLYIVHNGSTNMGLAEQLSIWTSMSQRLPAADADADADDACSMITYTRSIQVNEGIALCSMPP
jgi:hypothetical protein